MKEQPLARLSRRDAARLLGLSAGFALCDRIGLAAIPQRSAGSQGVAFPNGSIIRAVLNDLDPSSLTAATLYHEHMHITAAFRARMAALIAKPGSPPPPPPTPNYTEDRDLMIAELQAARKDGVGCLVEAGSASRGNIEYVKELSARSGMPIVAGGGYYLEAFYPPDFGRTGEDELAEGLARDARAQRWGAFGEIGTSAEFNPLQRKAFRVTGKAHLLTNLPILTHTPEGGDFRKGSKAGLEQLDIFESVGVRPQHVAIGHLDYDESLADVRRAVAKRGAYVGLDHAGLADKDPALVKMVLVLLDAGYADNILLSSDFASERDLKGNGGPGYAKTITMVVPQLRKAGVSDAIIHRITVDNPRRFLAFVPKNA